MRPSPERGRIDWRGRLETTVSLAMLPVGVVLALGSALAMLALCFAAIFLTVFALTSADGRAFYGLTALWCWAGAVASAYNTVTAIEALGGLDWRPMLRVALIAGLVALLYPGMLFSLG